MTTYVFLGPSLERAHAQQILGDVRYLPPARMGDIYRLCEDGQPAAIGLIDGLFERTPAVWHKEILYAISRGTRVYGGSSMGALRAAELHSFGMRGVGRIFHGYASGELEDDDEVAIVHGPAESGFAGQSEALVNLRYGLQDACAAGVIDAATAARCLALARGQFYPGRSWYGLFELARQAGLAQAEVTALQGYVERHRPNQKREDAKATLAAIASDNAAGVPASPPNFYFEPSGPWENLRTEYRGGKGEQVRFDHLRNHARLFVQTPASLCEMALLLELAAGEAARLHLPVPEQGELLEQLYVRRGMLDAEARAAWRRDNQVGEGELAALARLDFQLQEMARRLRARSDARLPDALRLSGLYASASSHVAAKQQALEEHQFHTFLQSDIAPLAEVQEWYRRRHGAAALPEVAAQGFDSPRELINELNAEYFYSRLNQPGRQ